MNFPISFFSDTYLITWIMLLYWQRSYKYNHLNRLTSSPTKKIFRQYLVHINSNVCKTQGKNNLLLDVSDVFLRILVIGTN